MSNVPTWVYILFFVLLYAGIKRCFTRTISVERLFIIPIIFIIMGIKNIALLLPNSVAIIYPTLGSVVGLCLGHWHVRKRIIKADKVHRLIQIPGDFSMLLLVIAIFIVEFFIHYAIDAHWPITHTAVFVPCVLSINGIIIGISLGRNMTYFYKFFHSQTTNLLANSTEF